MVILISPMWRKISVHILGLLLHKEDFMSWITTAILTEHVMDLPSVSEK